MAGLGELDIRMEERKKRWRPPLKGQNRSRADQGELICDLNARTTGKHVFWRYVRKKRGSFRPVNLDFTTVTAIGKGNQSRSKVALGGPFGAIERLQDEVEVIEVIDTGGEATIDRSKAAGGLTDLP